MPGNVSLSQTSATAQQTQTEVTQPSSSKASKVGKNTVEMTPTQQRAQFLLAREKEKIMQAKESAGYQITITPKVLTKQEQSERLYQTKNIIGTTSCPGQRPTVYYRSNSGSYGHITQEHKIQANIGREAVRKHPEYSMRNDGRNGALVEREGNHVLHKSRNPFVPVKNQAEREQLSQAHKEHTNIKDRAAIKQERIMMRNR
ncbi:hypothetical protein [Algicola sagamiensis]|uniref:hypothetical protein n=1 Tax=Algicola sagamiensis TaxID=163869 RepID=UPI00036C0D83|nr:hypothetical protein [Algicola sagamiensis]